MEQKALIIGEETVRKYLSVDDVIDENSFDIIIPDVLAGKSQARTNPKDRIYAQIIGTGMLDVACAGLLLKKIQESGDDALKVDMTK